jgi:hypothetical protein
MKKILIPLKLIYHLFFLSSCYSIQPQATQSSSAKVFTPSPETSTLVPPTAIALTMTPEPRWVTYEKALAEAVMRNSETICEWGILGTQKQEVYVLAVCRDKQFLSAATVPAVIYLNDRHEILQVVIPGDGDQYPKDIRKLFPPDIQEMIFSGRGLKFDQETAKKHLEMRLLDPTLPPLIAINGTILP